jgi:hypothetical protein
LLAEAVFLGSTKKFFNWGLTPLSAALIVSVAPNRKTGALPTVGRLRPLIQFMYPARTEIFNRNLRKSHTKTKTFIRRTPDINQIGK